MKRVVRPSAWSAQFNMTPMIDIIFQLIIFFLAVNQFQKAETDESIRLPKASANHVEPDVAPTAARVVLNIRPQEGIVAAGKPIPLAELGEFLRLQKIQADPAPLEVWIRSDRSVPFGQIEPILTTCADAGIWKLAFKVITIDIE
ncbi:biopolymer transporter ExbD [bacterium]|nr:biopolymer transporter ExbD [bacterium]